MVSLNASSEPQGELGPQPWITATATQAVMDALQADGTEVRFVGGCVRDTLAKRPVGDIDIATPDKPETVIKLLERAGIKAVPTGISHGTVTAVCEKKTFEITTLRRDEETDGRFAKVAFTDDWVADAERRDLTINAMSATRDGSVFDYNKGIADLAHGRVRFIGRADKRIEEDYLRILRFFRFHGGYGKPPLNRDAMAACRIHTERLRDLSGERIRQEFLKILNVPDPAEILLHMRGVGVLDVILPEAGDVAKLRMVNWLETRAVNVEGLTPDPVRHLAALIDPSQAEFAAMSISDRLKLSKKERTRLTDLAAPTLQISADSDDLEVRRAIRRIGPERTRDFTILNWADELVASSRLPRERTESYIDILELCAQWSPPEFFLTGSDVLALGIEAGPRVGELLERIEDWWENGGCRADRQECLDRLAKEARIKG